MRKFAISMVAATLGPAVLIGGLTPAIAKPRSGAALLSQCISNYQTCSGICLNSPYLPVDWSWKYCLDACEANHAACVDLAFSAARASGNYGALRPQPVRRRGLKSSVQ